MVLLFGRLKTDTPKNFDLFERRSLSDSQSSHLIIPKNQIIVRSPVFNFSVICIDSFNLIFNDTQLTDSENIISIAQKHKR